MKRTKLASVAAVFLVAGCTQQGVTATAPAPSSTLSTSTSSPMSSTSTKSTPVAPSSATSSSPAPADKFTKPFGSKLTWDDGLAVTISKPVPYKPSPGRSADATDKAFVVMDVLIENGTAQPIEGGLLSTRATTGDREAQRLFDSANGIDYPTAKVLPGKALKYRIAYGVDPAKDFILTVQAGFDRKEGIYTG